MPIKYCYEPKQAVRENVKESFYDVDKNIFLALQNILYLHFLSILGDLD